MSIFAQFSVPVTAFPPAGHLRSYPDVSVEVEEIVPTGSTTHYLWVVADDREQIIEALRADESVESVQTLDELDDRALVRVQWTGVTPLLELIEECDALLADATGTADGWTFTLRFPHQEALVTFYETCRRRGITLDLQNVSQSGFKTENEYGLTPAQRETVVAALEAGYFDVPRRTTIAELAEQLGLSDQAVSERLRRGLTRFLTATFGEENSGGPERDE